MQEDSGSDNFFCSALDLLICGLGATALLFILFSIVKSFPKSAGGVSNYLNVRFEVLESNGSALLKPILIPPDGKPIEVPIQAFDNKSGRLRGAGALAESFSSELQRLRSVLKENGRCSLVGFSVDGQGSVAASNRVFWLHLSNPIPGVWQVQALYFSSDSNALVSRADKIKVRTVAMTRQQRLIVTGEATFGEKTPEFLDGQRLPTAIVVKEN